MKVLRSLLVFVCILGAAGLAAVTLAGTPKGGTPSVAGYQVPSDLDGGHFRLAPLAQPVSIDAASALATAQDCAGGLATNPAGVSVQTATFTDEHRGIENADGSLTLSFVNMPAYIVRFTGVPQPIFGGKGSGSGPAAQELNVVINASTGVCIEMFSFK